MIDQEVKRLKAEIKTNEAVLKRPAVKYIMGNINSHNTAKQIIANNKKTLAAIELAWGIK